MKHAASFVTAGRMAGALLLLLTTPLSAAFYVIYSLCCVSDILDGFIARKTNTASRAGEILDSAADFLLTAVLLYLFIPLMPWEPWMLFWIGAVALIRFASLGAGLVKYRAFAMLHTYLNKATGLFCVCFPLLYQTLGLNATVIILCSAATLSALEELVIILSAKTLDRNTRGLFFKGK